MNPGAIYSKSGKGVQEASGKTSLLKRGDRAVLSAIDGRATLAEVAQKVGKPFDAAFETLITQLDKDGFVRAVSAGDTTPPAARTGGTPTAKAGGSGGGPDLDFTTIIPIPKGSPKAADAAQRAKGQESALYKARQEAEARAHAERERLKAEAAAKARAEMDAAARADAEKKVREEAEGRLRAEAEAKAKAAREAALRVAAEAKAKADAEKARLEAERARLEAERKAREEAERKAREEAERARREAEELRQRLEEERKAREEAERRAREEAERKAREEAERKAREEEERRAREEAERKEREEAERKARAEAERKAREDAERKEREEAERKARAEAERKAREEEERRAREEAERKEREEAERKARAEAERKAREEEERRARDEEERARRAHEEELERARREAEHAQAPAEPAPETAPAASTATTVVPGSLDTLMKDLDFFGGQEEEDRKSKEAAERAEKEENARRARQESERRAKEQAEAERRRAEERRQADERRRAEEESRRAQEEAERRAREAEEARKREAAERERKAREAAASAQQAQAAPPLDDIGITDEDLDMDEVRRDEAVVAKDSRKAQRDREREARERERQERQRERERRERAERERRAEPVKPSKPRRPVKWGRPVAISLFLLLAAAIGVLHIVPIPTQPYERAASEVFGHPVQIGSARVSLYSGLRLDLEHVKIGDTALITRARAYPELGSLFGDRKAFSRIEIDNLALAPQALGEALLARMKGANFSVARVIVKELKIEGGLPLPVVEADAASGPDGAVRTVLLRGPDNLLGKITPSGGNVEFDVTASAFPLPVAPSVSLTSFAMKGTATRQGMNVASWGGAVFDGALSGVANVRWGAAGWHIDGVVTVRNINAAVFAPALLSEGRAEGTAKFSMSSRDPAKLGDASRIEGRFTVYKGVLGSFDLSRLIQTSGRQSSGRTQFAEMTGQGTYDRGAVALREVQISAGALNAGASADIAQSGALSGRIIADVKTATQTLRQTIVLGGTVKEPQVRN